ncbi:MAG: hypothetical protein LBT38_08510 [Deltaproteobacteria bacterium]|jgi:hypothetical protein|nr:hypothetical protein [Deltaproteobacteria bacterium]
MPELVVTTEIEEGQVFLLTPGIKFSAGKNGPRTFKGVAYSGEVITDQGFWDKVVFDVSEIKFSHERMPTLRDHDPGKILGFTTGFDKANDQLTARGVFFGEEPRGPGDGNNGRSVNIGGAWIENFFC